MRHNDENKLKLFLKMEEKIKPNRLKKVSRANEIKAQLKLFYSQVPHLEKKKFREFLFEHTLITESIFQNWMKGATEIKPRYYNPILKAIQLWKVNL